MINTKVSCFNLIFIFFLVLLCFGRIDTDFFVVLLESSQILTSLGEFSFLHTLSDVPMDESTLGVHQIELVVETSPGLGDGCGVAQHADGTLNLCKITTRDDGGWLVVDTNLEASWTPVNELDGTLGLDGSDGGVDILGDDITSVEETACHVLAVTGIALHHLVGGLEAGVGDLGNGQLLMVGLLSRDDWSIGNHREMDTWVGHQVGLELSQIDIEGTIESQRSGDGGDDLANETVEVGVGGTLDVEVTSANIVDGLVVDHEGTVGVLEGGVSGKDGVVGLDNSGGDLRSRVDGELQFGLLPVIYGETLHEQGGEARASAATEAVKEKESLETCALVSQLPDAIQDLINEFFADGVVTTGVVVGSILLAGDQLLRMEELTVGTGTDLI